MYLYIEDLHLVLWARKSFKTRHNINEATYAKQDKWL